MSFNSLLRPFCANRLNHTYKVYIIMSMKPSREQLILWKKKIKIRSEACLPLTIIRIWKSSELLIEVFCRRVHYMWLHIRTD